MSKVSDFTIVLNSENKPGTGYSKLNLVQMGIAVLESLKGQANIIRFVDAYVEKLE